MNKIYKILDNKKIKYAVIAILALLAMVSIVQGARNAAIFSQDFQYDATKAFALRINPYLESLSPSGILDELNMEEYYFQMEANQFPSLLMLLIPFTFLKPLTARYVWLACNLLFTVMIIWLLRKTFLKDVQKDIFAMLSLLMLAGTPYRNQLGVGQHTLFAFTFFLLAVFFSEKEKGSVPTVICLIVCYFKYTLTVPLVLYFIYKKKYTEIAASVIVHIILTGVSAWWLRDSFINMIVQPLKVSSALAAEGGLDFGALLNGSKLSFVLAFLVMVGLFALMLKAPKGLDGEVISVLTLWSLIITYHRTYDFFVIIIVAAYFYSRKQFFASNQEYWEDTNNLISVIGFIIVVLAVFFVLRIFSEAAFSKIAVGSIYYIYTVYLTVVCIKDISRIKQK